MKINKLLKILSILLLFSITTGFGVIAFSDGLKNENNRIEVTFNRTMDFNDLVKVKLDLAENGISINYTQLEFDENGGSKSLNFYVDCNDGFKGSAKNTNLLNQSNWGFYRDYNENIKSPFGTGSLNR